MTQRSRARIAVVGTGWWTQGWHLPHLRRNEHAEIVALVNADDHPQSSLDPNLVSLNELASAYDVDRTYHAVEELVADDVALDGVLVATPHATHAQIGIALVDEAHRRLDRGEAPLNLLIEKPMTTNVHQALALHDAVTRYQQHADRAAQPAGVAMLNHTANYRLPCVAARRLVAEHKLGRVQHVEAHFASPLMWIFGDPSNVGWNKPSGPDMLGNGFGWGQQSHLLAWIFFVTGLVPTEVYCRMQHSEVTGADLSHSATIRCGDDCAISVSGTTLLPGNAHSTPAVGKRAAIDIYGTEGALLYGGVDDDPSTGRLELRRHDERHGHPTYPLGDDDPGFLFENLDSSGTGPESMRLFLDACCNDGQLRDGDVIGADVAVGLSAIQALDAMYRSHASGRPEPIVW